MTAFANDNALSLQAFDFCTTGFTRWGWTNGPYPDGTSNRHLEIWAGSVDCIKYWGRYVGTAEVTVLGDTVAVKVTRVPYTGYTFTELHIQVSCDPLKYALQGDAETVTPGQYTYGSDDPDPTEEVVTFAVAPASGQLSIDGLTEAGECTSKQFWVIIHAVSCLKPSQV